MRTLAEYENIFSMASRQILDVPSKTEQEARHMVAMANKAVRMARDAYTLEITQTWKVGFAALKKQNDDRQVEVWREFKHKENEINADMLLAIDYAKKASKQ